MGSFVRAMHRCVSVCVGNGSMAYSDVARVRLALSFCSDPSSLVFLSAYESHLLHSYSGIKRDRIDVNGF